VGSRACHAHTRNKDGTVERLAVISLFGDDWSDAPVTAENADTDIILV
jgi:hypothetical protein